MKALNVFGWSKARFGFEVFEKILIIIKTTFLACLCYAESHAEHQFCPIDTKMHLHLFDRNSVNLLENMIKPPVAFSEGLRIFLITKFPVKIIFYESDDFISICVISFCPHGPFLHMNA